ncbi:unnamed protein product, partial [Ectocarpus sp. 12 AP-2014]
GERWVNGKNAKSGDEAPESRVRTGKRTKASVSYDERYTEIKSPRETKSCFRPGRTKASVSYTRTLHRNKKVHEKPKIIFDQVGSQTSRARDRRGQGHETGVK